MTDNEIIKALECCISAENCCECVYTKMCDGTTIHQFTLDLINRQKAENEHLQYLLVKNNAEIAKQETEIERLQNEIGSLNKAYPCIVNVGNNCLVYARSLDDYDKFIGDVGDEAIKEFAERLKGRLRDCSKCEIGSHTYYMVGNLLLDSLVKEMVGADNGGE